MTTAVTILCCLCGTPIVANAANQCNACLAQQFNLKELLHKNSGELLEINQCRQCRRFARTPTVFEHCDPESPQLLSICLKHIPAFVNAKSTSAKLHIVDAIWVWTEPHSMRLKVRVTIRTELENVQMQQRVMVEYQIKWKQCSDCNREYTSRTWQALVQLRQKREQGAPRKGLATLEMALRRNTEIRKHVLRIDSCRHGLDFYFLTFAQAQNFASFLSRLAPMRVKTSQKLVSTDVKSNTANVKHTFTADMVPLCRDDLILVGKGSRGLLSGRLGLVLKVTSNIQLVDAAPKRTSQMDTMDISAESYNKVGGDKTFPILQSADRMIRWVVLDVEPCDPNQTSVPYQGTVTPSVSKYRMANVLVARESDMGQNDATYSCVTHLGNLIAPGDIVLGYDLESTSATLSTSTSLGVVDLEDVVHSNVVLPDVVLVKKVSGSGLGHDDPSNSGGDPLDSGDDDDDEPVRQGKKRISKRKLRRRQKQDKKQRELEGSAVRMGFLDDAAGGGGEEPREDHGFDTELSQDPELAADLEAVEKQLASFQPAAKEDTEADEKERNSNEIDVEIKADQETDQETGLEDS